MLAFGNVGAIRFNETSTFRKSHGIVGAVTIATLIEPHESRNRAHGDRSNRSAHTSPIEVSIYVVADPPMGAVPIGACFNNSLTILPG